MINLDTNGGEGSATSLVLKAVDVDERLEALDNSIAGRDTSAYIVTRWRGYWCELATGNPNKAETIAPRGILGREFRNPDTWFWIGLLLIVVAFLGGWDWLARAAAGGIENLH